MDPRITVCIVHYNKVDKLKNTINALKDHTDEPYLLKVLNNGYEDDQVKSYLSKLNKEETVEIMYNEENVGCPPGRYQLLQDIETPYAMTLDDDMYVEEGWLKSVMDIFEADSDIGVIGIPYMSSKDGELRGGAHVSINSGVVKLEHVDWSDVDEDDTYLPVNDVPGGTMVLRKELLDNFNWDPQFFVGMGDIDKSLQIMGTDWKQVMATNLVFEHDIKISPDYRKIRMDYQERHKSYRKFVSKWGYRYPLRRHLIFNYFFRLPWPVMSMIESLYQRMS